MWIWWSSWRRPEPITEKQCRLPLVSAVKKRNAELAGSSPVSKHLEGKAADVWIVGTAANNAALVKWFQAQPEVNYSYTGFGAVHVDVK